MGEHWSNLAGNFANFMLRLENIVGQEPDANEMTQKPAKASRLHDVKLQEWNC